VPLDVFELIDKALRKSWRFILPTFHLSTIF
jgi:hypothetical protein